MGSLHLVGGPTAAKSLYRALDGSPGRAADSVVWFPDALGIGPLAPNGPTVRAEWWQWWDEMTTAYFDADPEPPETYSRQLAAFWDRVDSADRLVAWYGRDNADESAFFHALCDRLGDRPLDVVALPGAIGAREPGELARQLDAARPVTATERSAVHRTWKRLEQENLTFRIVRDGALVSAPADHYDRALLEAAGADWTVIVRIVAPVMAAMSVADVPLIWRVQTLVESGAMVADGNPWLARQTKVKLAQRD
ncbi:DUF3658 domain-containing protein [Nocardia huaxiensis]|uniref:DUF1835 domain-containing protein n=1 Tax=Nocardia huaxiensis TaxID=2755382 RepID=A0A7D6V6N8_9NOCA|nr:DUF3658 domain-containing protein [Nocardia huaxiensis]QLY28912.1 DUF1835 domain-containing protein [Nocardia huaxiensis]UFS97613.1 DUF1835 domain-containing protein [Nocardia huaxiensis]